VAGIPNNALSLYSIHPDRLARSPSLAFQDPRVAVSGRRTERIFVLPISRYSCPFVEISTEISHFQTWRDALHEHGLAPSFFPTYLFNSCSKCWRAVVINWTVSSRLSGIPQMSLMSCSRFLYDIFRNSLQKHPSSSSNRNVVEFDPRSYHPSDVPSFRWDNARIIKFKTNLSVANLYECVGKSVYLNSGSQMFPTKDH
jgi:hypothetical protein